MTSFADLAGGAERSQSPDDQMEKIRELLVGEIVRQTEARIASLEARIKELEGELGRRLDALAARIETLGSETAAERQSAFEELSRGVADLGKRIRNLSQSK